MPSSSDKPVYLVHWNAAEAEQRAGKLRDAGYVVDCRPLTPAVLRRLREDPPAAFVIDLGRLPSQGRDLGVGLRSYKSTRNVPLVFVGGDPEKVRRVRELLPDAVYTSRGRIRSALGRAIARPPADPVVPKSPMAGYAGAPLVKKLGIKEHAVVLLIGAPQGFERTLGKLPDGVVLRSRAGARCDLALWFVKSQKELNRRIEKMVGLAENGGLWIVWPKKSSGVAGDLTQPVVRKIGLAASLVDYKVCSIDATWTGLRFTRKRRGR
jgi:hypothetical protein